jgi:hypothetical protein
MRVSVRNGPSDLPDGQSARLLSIALSSPYCKNILIFRKCDSVYIRRHPVPHEGRFAIVTDVGCGMRWTRAALQDEQY